MVTADGEQGELSELEFGQQQKEADEVELRFQLKEAGRLLSNPSDSVDELLFVLDQLWKLLLKVDQSPNNVMKEALNPSMKALVDGRLLEHSSMDVKVSVASCLCEITRITAPEAPYSDEELKAVFKCIVSSLEDLSDKSSQSYDKRVSILDIVSKVRSCVIMLDLECDDLLVKLFEHFLNSVRDHHLGDGYSDVFSLMVNIMALVLEESEDISLDMLKPLIASVKSKGVSLLTRKLGEEVIKRSADKIRPYLNKAMASFGESLVDYSQLLTSVVEGTPNVVEHKDESASNKENVVDALPAVVPDEDAAPVVSNGDVAIGDEEHVDDHQSKNPAGAVDQPVSNSENVILKADTTTKSVEPVVSETVHGENAAEKSPEIVNSVQKPLETEVANAPSQSDSQQEESQSTAQIKKGVRSKEKGSSQTDVLTKVNEVVSDAELKSPKRVRKKTEKAEENKHSVTTGSDVEPSKNTGNKVETGDSGSKPVKRSGKKAVGGGSVAKKRKLSGKKVLESKKSKQDDNTVKKRKPSGKKVPESKKSKQDDNETDSAVKVKPLKPSGKKGNESKVIAKPSEEDVADKDDEETDSDNTPLKVYENKEEKTGADHKPVKLSEDIDDEETDSDNIPLKLSAKRGNKNISLVKPSSKNKDGKKQGRGKNVEEKDQETSLSEDDDGMDVSLKSVLKKVTKGKGNLDGALSTGSKRKRSVTKKKATKAIKYDDSLVGQKVKVWWPEDKMYYEGVVESFDSAEKTHKVSYVDGDVETLNLRKERWEIVEKFSSPIKEVAVEVQNPDILPETAGSSEGENKVNTKEVESKEDEKSRKDKKTTPKKRVYSRGKKGSKSKTKSTDDDDVKESGGENAAEEPESEKEKSTETPKVGSKTGKKKRKVN